MNCPLCQKEVKTTNSIHDSLLILKCFSQECQYFGVYNIEKKEHRIISKKEKIENKKTTRASKSSGWAKSRMDIVNK